MFISVGIPDKIISDNGPQYAADEFKTFAKKWGFEHKTTNPYCPQENNMAERAVQTAKHLLKLDNPEIGLMNYRATPHSATGVTPAAALMGRENRQRLPVLSEKLKPKQPNDSEIRKSDQTAKDNKWSPSLKKVAER